MSSRQTRWLPLFAALVVGVVWLPVLQNGLVWDDFGVVVGKESVRTLNWADMVRLPLWADVAAFDGAAPYYRPLVVLSFGLDHAVAGAAPWFIHLHSLLWHLLNVALVVHLGGRKREAVLAGVLFGLHPSLLEAVAFAAARNDLMVATFALLGLLALRGQRWAWLAVFCLAAGFTKESALVLPFVFSGAAWSQGKAARAFLAAAAGTGIVWAVRLWLRVGLGSADGPPASEATRAALSWFGWLVLPVGVAPTTGLGSELPALWLAGLGALVGLAWSALRGPAVHRWVAPAVGLLLATGIPAVLDTGLYSSRYVYLPLALLGVSLIPWVLGRVAWLGPLLIAGAMGLTLIRIPEWQSGETLFGAAVKRDPNARAHRTFGNVLNAAGEPEAALIQYDRALDFPGGAKLACPNLATALARYPTIGAPHSARWEAAGCRTQSGFDDALVWALVRTNHWPEAARIATSQTVADTSFRGTAVRGALRLADGDWTALSLAATRHAAGAADYLDRAYGVHLAAPTSPTP